MPEYVRYRDDLETIDPDEPETIQKIIDLHVGAMHAVRDRHAGENVRASHAKAYGFVRGELVVADDLLPELAQGLFATPGRRYPVVVRLASVPGELLDDRKVSSPRGMAIKVFGVDGEKLPGHAGNATQDFVLDTGKAFVFGTAKAFAAGVTPNLTLAPRLSDTAKGLVSKAASAANAALHAVGLDSAKLDFYGHPSYHPLGEAYYTQVPIRYGDHVAKLGVVPANPALEALYQRKIDTSDEESLRRETVAFFRSNPAEYAVQVQLCADPAVMPIEDASVEWPEDVSPYQTVARLVLPPQDAYDAKVQDAVDHDWSFSPSHALAAHRPLGSIMRARLAAYPMLAEMRRRENGRPTTEPAAPDLPAVAGSPRG